MLGVTPLRSLFLNDFWGTDISRDDSHKSYRPLTVLSFRMDHSIYGLDPFGYHTTNVIIYVCSCIAVYAVATQWLSGTGTVRIQKLRWQDK